MSVAFQSGNFLSPTKCAIRPSHLQKYVPRDRMRFTGSGIPPHPYIVDKAPQYAIARTYRTRRRQRDNPNPRTDRRQVHEYGGRNPPDIVVDDMHAFPARERAPAMAERESGRASSPNRSSSANFAKGWSWKQRRNKGRGSKLATTQQSSKWGRPTPRRMHSGGGSYMPTGQFGAGGDFPSDWLTRPTNAKEKYRIS